MDYNGGMCSGRIEFIRKCFYFIKHIMHLPIVIYPKTHSERF